MYAVSKSQSRETTKGSGGAVQHPVFSYFSRWRGAVPPGFIVNFLGVVTRVSYFESYAEVDRQYPPDRNVQTEYPDFDEEYFEWIDLLEAVMAARDHFTMLELGAGYGRWTVNAAAALRKANGPPHHLIAVEAEPTHFQWMAQHLADNSVAPSSCRLIQAAVAPADGEVGFHLRSPQAGGPSQWYGQCIGGSELVHAASLETLLRPLQTVDLIDLDVQGAEFDVLSAAAQQLDQKVKRVHIGTHGPRVEAHLHSLFNRLGWECVRSYPCGAPASTSWGEISFGDGVQSWINPSYSDSSKNELQVLAKKLDAARQEGGRLWQEVQELRRERETLRIMEPSSPGWRFLTKAGLWRDRIAPSGSRRRKWADYLTGKI